MYKRVAFAWSAANPQKMLPSREENTDNTERDPYLPITSCFSVLKSDLHTTEIRTVMNIVKSRNHRTEHNLGTAVAFEIGYWAKWHPVHTYHLSMLLPCFSAMRKPNFPRSAENL